MAAPDKPECASRECHCTTQAYGSFAILCGSIALTAANGDKVKATCTCSVEASCSCEPCGRDGMKKRR